MTKAQRPSQQGQKNRALRFFVAVLLALGLTGCLNGQPNDDEHSPSATNETGFGDEYWASLAQNFEPFERPFPPLGAAYGAADLQFVGNWSAVLDWPLIATGAANLPDGTVLAWSSQFPDAFNGPEESTLSTIYDPTDNSFSPRPNSSHDMFCAGVSMLADGRVFVAGGGNTVSTTSVFDTDQFNQIESMAATRWYPTSTTLSSGQVLTTLGTTATPFPELWTNGQGWDLQENVNLQGLLNQQSIPYRDWYPALNVAPDGSLFHPGHMPDLFSIHLADEQAVHSHGIRNGNDTARLYNTTVMYDIGKMLFAGGGDQDSTNAAYLVDLNGQEPSMTPIDAMTHKRAMQNSVVLPSGEVLVIGGNTSGIQFSDEGTVLEPEMWNPVTGQWRVMAPHDRPRNYHSTALLLKDARVLAAGGGLCGECPTNHQNGEIFTPPYLFDAQGELRDRPAITGGSDEAFPGQSITLQGSDDIVAFNLLRLVAITHHHTTDQRLIPTNFVKTAQGEYRLDLNSNTNVLLPGNYWVFGLNAEGTPTSGHTVQIKIAPENIPPVNSVITANVEYEYYEGLWSPLKLPNFDNLTPVKTGSQADFSLTERLRDNFFAFRFRGQINIPTTGQYIFFLASDDGSRLLINGQQVVDHDGAHALEQAPQQGRITLGAGQHDIEVQFFEATGGEALFVSWQGPGFAKQPVQAIHLGSTVQSAPVVIEPPSGTLEQVEYAYYEGSFNTIPNFNNLTPIKRGNVSGFNLDEREQNDFYAFRFKAKLAISVAGNYSFYTTSDDGSRLLIDGATVVSNDGLHAPRTRKGTTTLQPGEHEIVVEFFEKAGGDSLLVEWERPGLGRQIIPLSVLSSTFIGSTDNGSDSDGSDANGGDSTDSGTTSNPEATTSLAGLLNYDYFEGRFETLADFASSTPTKTGTTPGFNLDERDQETFFAFRYSGKLTISAPGTYEFFSESDDGSSIAINGTNVVNNDGRHRPRTENGTIQLDAGEHDIEVNFFQSGGGKTLNILWVGPGFAKQPIPVSVLSATTSGTDTDTTSNPVDPDTSAQTGVRYQYFEGIWSALPDFDSLAPVSEGIQNTFGLEPRSQNDNYGFRFAAVVNVTTGGRYTFYTNSDDGSALYVNGEKVVDNDGLHAVREQFGSLTLPAGEHHIRVEFFERGRRDTLDVSWSGPGFTKQPLHDSPLTVADFND